MTTAAEAMNLPFDEAIAFFRSKVNLPTESWTDLWQGRHARAFVVAGATQSALLTDFRAAVDKAIAKGTTLKEFREDFDNIVAKHGWDYRGGRNWRSAVIFNTNLSTAQAAGRYRQMTDPTILKLRPYWRYIASSSVEKRPEHVAWYNVTLRHDDPFWQTHWPPNGWGCKCGVASVSPRELERLKVEEADGPHPIRTEAPAIEHYDWTDKATGRVHRVPKGIDPGWDYNVGRAAWGDRLTREEMGSWEAVGPRAYERITPGDWRASGRPERIPVDRTETKLGKRLSSKAEAALALHKILGGSQASYAVQAGTFRYDFVATADWLGNHVDLGRSPWFPLIPEILSDPYEIWMYFERHKGTGKMDLRVNVVKAIETDKARGMFVGVQAQKGALQSMTFFPPGYYKDLNKKRVGTLIFARDE